MASKEKVNLRRGVDYLAWLEPMMRAEYQPDGPVTELAREVCGLGKIGADQGEKAADYAKAQDAKTG
jgi:hypothetical protein